MHKAIELSNKYNTVLNKYNVNTPLRRLHFFTQIGAESNYISQAEKGGYSKIETLRATFLSPFKGKNDDFVRGYLNNSVKLFNYVYANRGGNNNELSGDGYKFRGRGLLQNTFKNQYATLSKILGVDLIKNPDLLLQEPNAIIAALEYWKNNNLNKYADMDHLDHVSDVVNLGKVTARYGDSNGFAHRLKVYNELRPLFIK